MHNCMQVTIVSQSGSSRYYIGLFCLPLFKSTHNIVHGIISSVLAKQVTNVMQPLISVFNTLDTPPLEMQKQGSFH